MVSVGTVLTKQSGVLMIVFIKVLKDLKKHIHKICFMNEEEKYIVSREKNDRLRKIYAVFVDYHKSCSIAALYNKGPALCC